MSFVVSFPLITEDHFENSLFSLECSEKCIRGKFFEVNAAAVQVISREILGMLDQYSGALRTGSTDINAIQWLFKNCVSESIL